LKVFDELGREIKTLVSGYKVAGKYSVNFDASKLASGIYYYRISAGGSTGSPTNFTEVKKLLLLK